MFEFLRLGLKPTVRVQRERAEAGALLRLCCKHISKKRNAVKRERARQPGEFFIAKQKPAFKSLLKASCTYSKGDTSVCEKKY